MKKNTGFTLIELLVVIAIIGILSSVVLASLNTARNKGNLAKVQAQVNGVRVAAENYYSGTNNYGTTQSSCAGPMFTDTTSGVAAYVTESNYPSGTTITCTASSTAYAVRAQYTGVTPAMYVCADSSGSSVSTTTAMSIADGECDTN